MAKTLVLQFQEEIISGQRTIQDLLRMAQLISGKLGLTDLQQWIEHELNGYPDEKSVPDYRTATSSTLQCFNPYRGWVNVVGQKTYTFVISQAVAELEGFATRDHLEMTLPYAVPVVSLTGDPHSLPKMNQRFILSGTEFVRILGTVKNKLLAWSVELEQRGILGENMAFNEKERDSAKHQTFNIQNVHGVVGDVTGAQVNVYDYSSFHQMLKEHGVSQNQRNELENLIDELKEAKPENKKAAKSKILAWITSNAASLGTLAVELTKVFTG